MPDFPIQNKKPWQSKTIVLSSLLAISQALLPFIPQLEDVNAWINSHGMVVTFFWSALAMALRFITHGKIALSD